MVEKLATFVFTMVCPVGLTWAARASTDSFQESLIAVGKEPASVAVADLNHDGKLDIVVANTGSESISVLLGDGKGNFQPSLGSPFPAGHLPNDIVLGDFNHDGNVDLLIPNHQTPYVTILLGDGKGGFQPGAALAVCHTVLSTSSRRGDCGLQWRRKVGCRDR
jgi:hypothetical protein